MGTISESQKINLSNYTDAAPSPPPAASMPEPILLPTRNSALRFTAPYLPGTFPSSDNLTGYHIGGSVPQNRIPIPSQAAAQGAGASTSTAVISSSSSSTTTNNPAKA